MAILCQWHSESHDIEESVHALLVASWTSIQKGKGPALLSVEPAPDGQVSPVFRLRFRNRLSVCTVAFRDGFSCGNITSPSAFTAVALCASHKVSPVRPSCLCDVLRQQHLPSQEHLHCIPSGKHGD